MKLTLPGGIVAEGTVEEVAALSRSLHQAVPVSNFPTSLSAEDIAAFREKSDQDRQRFARDLEKRPPIRERYLSPTIHASEARHELDEYAPGFKLGVSSRDLPAPKRKETTDKAVVKEKKPASPKMLERMAVMRAFKDSPRQEAVGRAVVLALAPRLVDFLGKVSSHGTATIKDGISIWPLRIRDANGKSSCHIAHSDLSVDWAYAVFFSLGNVVYIPPTMPVVGQALIEKRGLTINGPGGDNVVTMSNISKARGVPKTRAPKDNVQSSAL
jgi:hypothetical protein